MSSEKIAVESSLRHFLKSPESFDFFQAVRLLQNYSRLVNHKQYSINEPNAKQDSAVQDELATQNPINPTDFVRFRAHVSNSFSAGSIQNAHTIFRKDRRGNAVRQIEILVNFFGLHGPNGILPRHYTDDLIQLERISNQPESKSLRDFLDMFNNRLIFLFYQAWEKYQIPVHQEIDLFTGSDSVMNLLKSLGGIGTSGLSRRIGYVPVEKESDHRKNVSDLFLSCYLARSRNFMSVAGVQNLVKRITGDRARIRCLSGQWVNLKRSEISRLGNYGTNRTPPVLGSNAILGSRIWANQSEYVLEIGPVSWNRLKDYIPDGSANCKSADTSFLNMIFGILKLKTDTALRPRVQVMTDVTTIPPLSLSSLQSGSVHSSKLGINTWLGDASRHSKFDVETSCNYRNDTVFRCS